MDRIVDITFHDLGELANALRNIAAHHCDLDTAYLLKETRLVVYRDTLSDGSDVINIGIEQEA